MGHRDGGGSVDFIPLGIVGEGDKGLAEQLAADGGVNTPRCEKSGVDTRQSGSISQ